MFFSLTRSCGIAILVFLWAGLTAPGQQQSPPSDTPEPSTARPHERSTEEKPASSSDDFVKSLGVRIPADVAALAEIIRRMRESVEQIPNYTCVQTIRRKRVGERKQKRGKARLRDDGFTEIEGTLPLDSTDTVKIEVAYADGKEMYSWPGAKRFEEKSLPSIVGFGTVSTGDFAAHARTLFVNRNAQFSYHGEADFEGRETLRYDFRVPLFQSGYTISDLAGNALVGYNGSIWADATTKNLLRIEVRADEIPAPLTISSVVNRLDYARVLIGEREFQLPKRAHLATYFQSGARNHNWVEFSNCREFGAQSELSFEEPAEEPVIETSLTPAEFPLPVGTVLRLRLNTPIHSATSSAGDELRATVTRAVKQQGETLIPKGAVAVGRLRRLESFSEPRDHFIVAFVFTRVEFATKWVDLHAKLADMASFPGLRGEFGKSRSVSTSSRGFDLQFPTMRTVEKESYQALTLPGTAELYIERREFSIPSGHRMVWTTTGE